MMMMMMKSKNRDSKDLLYIFNSPRASTAKPRFFFLSNLLMDKKRTSVFFGSRSPRGSTFLSKAAKLREG